MYIYFGGFNQKLRLAYEGQLWTNLDIMFQTARHIVMDDLHPDIRDVILKQVTSWLGRAELPVSFQTKVIKVNLSTIR